MYTLLFNPAQIVTVDTRGENLKRGNILRNLDVLTGHSILIKNEQINQIIPNDDIVNFHFDDKIDLSDKIILPGLTECHTHLVFAGSRADEFGMRLKGVSYEEIAKNGGGINSTVQAVRKSSFEELINLSKPRVENFIRQGVTTLEIKSGYGLSYYDEIKLLEVINELNKIYTIDIVPTFLGAHTYPPEYLNDKQQYIDVLTKEIIPYVSENSLAKSCDAFCEVTAFSSKQVMEIFRSANNNNLDLKLHTDQFNNIGGIDIALEYNSRSVDHLEVVKDSDISKISSSETVAVLLPGVSLSLKYNYAPARKLIDSDAIVALATDYNPGSSHINNISMIWGLAAFNMQMSPEEIISSYTINSAKALNVSDKVGSIELDKKADFAIFDANNYADLIYHTGQNLCSMTIKNGKIVNENPS